MNTEQGFIYPEIKDRPEDEPSIGLKSKKNDFVFRQDKNHFIPIRSNILPIWP